MTKKHFIFFMDYTKLNTHDKTLINKISGILYNSMEFQTLQYYILLHFHYITLAITVTHLPLLRLLSTLAFCKISEKVLDTNFTPSIKKNEML